jgi:hypothetical protein
MRTIEIIEAGLRANGFSGLVLPGVCGCVVGDISPGECLSEQCYAAYRHEHSNGSDWITSTEKDGVTDADIERIIAEC